MTWAEVLPVIFMALMGLSMLAYVVLDGYDLGVGMLPHRADDAQKDMIIASIGPFWGANETWLVLGVGSLLIAFPKAHGIILTALYLPVTLMLVGLMLRGVTFDFRVKARDNHKPLWNRAFLTGSAIASLAQGWMLGRYITGFADGWVAMLFAAAIALLPIPLMTPAALIGAGATLNSSRVLGRMCWPPFALVITAFLLGAFGLAYSLYPDIVIDRLTIWEAASATESLAVILVGCAVAVPAIVGYTVFAYRVFWGKARALDYA